MRLEQIMERINSYNGRVGGLDIAIDEFTKADFVLGCYFDENKKKWIVYENGERGIHFIRLETDDQKAAFETLLSMIEYERWIES